MLSEVKTKLARRVNTRTSASNRNWKLKFLASMRHIANVSYACRQSKVSRVAAYAAREADAKFSAEWDDALKEGFDALEAVCIQHSVEGVERPIWMKDENGKPIKVGVNREYPWGHYAMLLKAHKPAIYNVQRDTLNLNATTTAPDGTKAEFVVHLSAEELP